MDAYKYLKIIVKDELKAIKEQFRESKALLIAFVVCLAGIVVYLQPFHSIDVSIATSYKDSDWYDFGKTSATYLAKNGLNTAVVTTDGAIDNVNQLNDPKNPVNVAFTYGVALSKEQKAGISSLGSIAYNPVWIFYRKDRINNLQDLHDLANYRVGLGPTDSGSYVISKKLLALYDVDIEKNKKFQPDTFLNTESKFIQGDLDALIVVSGYQDPIVQKLLRLPNVELFSFNNAAAFEKKFNFVEAVTIPAGSINIYPKIPAKNIDLIATTTSVVVKKDMHPDLQLAVLMALKDMVRNSNHLFFSKRNEFPAYVDPLIPISATAAKFYDYGPPKTMQYLPFWIAGFIDRAWLLLLTLVAIFYPLSKLNLHIRKLRFVVHERPHYEELLEIDEMLSVKKLTDDEKREIIERLENINRSAIKARVPIGEESHYFELVNAIYLLRRKLEIH